MDPRGMCRALGIGRIAVGAVLTIAPRRGGEAWMGDLARQPATALAVRSLGARDVAIGVGLVRALDAGSDPRPWLLASAAADAADAAGTLIAWRRLPSRGRLMTLIVASGATALALQSSRRVA